ncbi:uncharacterized protein LOC122373385 isoform X2 [Amphibalanus amphitrite]|uniref:uncharacterized protein LOC122373385 isoform X2 n=1 Tax=Amphibalanus amphitrite TaxID=1232801 RepID=UPI001C90D84D|nr:uncharacterized protein LOC122373385 isoform X2 [Amphibalanus amphitrite]
MTFQAHTNFDGEDEPVPTAPPLDILDSVPGYESLGFDAVCVPPPPPEATWSEPSGPPPRDPVHVGGELSEQQARAALLSRDRPLLLRPRRGATHEHRQNQLQLGPPLRAADVHREA